VKILNNFRIYVRISGPNSNFRTNFKISGISGQRPSLTIGQKRLQMLGDITSKDYVTLKKDAHDRSNWQKNLSQTGHRAEDQTERINRQLTQSGTGCQIL